MSESYNAEERKLALKAMLETDGWQAVALPALRERLGSARLRLEVNLRLNIEEVRLLQAEVRLLRDMLERPREFFGL